MSLLHSSIEIRIRDFIRFGTFKSVKSILNFGIPLESLSLIPTNDSLEGMAISAILKSLAVIPQADISL